MWLLFWYQRSVPVQCDLLCWYQSSMSSVWPVLLISEVNEFNVTYYPDNRGQEPVQCDLLYWYQRSMWPIIIRYQVIVTAILIPEVNEFNVTAILIQEVNEFNMTAILIPDVRASSAWPAILIPEVSELNMTCYTDTRGQWFNVTAILIPEINASSMWLLYWYQKSMPVQCDLLYWY